MMYIIFFIIKKYYIIVLNIMFFCKNDKTRSYKGSEPSPKGFGICAHAEKMNTIQKGTDGNMWKIQKTSNNIKRWVKITPTLIIRNIKNLSIPMLLNNFNLLLKKSNIKSDMYKVYYETYDALIKHNTTSCKQKILEKVESTKKLNKHIINIKNKIILSDPSFEYIFKNIYQKRSNLHLKFSVKPGKWIVYYQTWLLNKPNILVMVHENYINNTNNIKYYLHRDKIGIDTGTLVIMDESNYPRYKKFSSKQQEWATQFYVNKFFKKIENGYSVTTGFGDGFYQCMIGKDNKKIVKIIVNFMI
jgi:hypothetical protein